MTSMSTIAAPQRTPARHVRPRLAGAHIDAMTADSNAPARGLVIGNAGSGKTATLRHLGSVLPRRGVHVVVASPGMDLTGIPPADVVLVDDAHLLDDDALAVLAERVDDPAAGIVVACRPWPQSEGLRSLARRLEASHPAIVLGHLTAADMLSNDRAGDLSAACVDDILERCGNATWLVTEALAVHDEEQCALGPDHDAITEALREIISHRTLIAGPDLRNTVETLCLAPEGRIPVTISEDLLAAGHAEGLLQRNGQPSPVVRAAVRATVTAQRIAAYERAATGGADPAAVDLGRARAAWAAGRLDAAGSYADTLLTHTDPAVREQASQVSAAVWAARGQMIHSDATYRATASADSVRAAHAFVAAVAVGDATGFDAQPPAGTTAPSTLTVSAQLLARGLGATLSTAHDEALGDLVRAAETYTASGSADPIPELPAVIAALVAVHSGELEVAGDVLESAIRDRHAGAWARPRLLLWRAWIDLQRQCPADAESALRAVADGGPVSPRERMLVDALRLGLARRYSDAAGLATAWRSGRETILRAQFDLFSILPLGEFAVSAARVGDSGRVRGHLTRALADMKRLGSPPLWAPHLHWAGIQEGILLNSPESLRPHARELLAAAPHNRVAARMAQAGRVWTSVLAGSVDADAVEDAAMGLADVGLAWDGARLAGHGAGRTDDRRTISRLLACARQLHPHEAVRADDEDADTAVPARAAATLSAREREVALLVMQGMTYAEIGETIFISPRTAEHHIARIRRRLGASSRSDLIAKLRVAIDGAADDLPTPPPSTRSSEALVRGEQP